MSDNKIFNFPRKECSFDLSNGFDAIDSEIKYMDQARELLSFAADSAKDAAKEVGLSGMTFSVDFSSVKNICEWVRTDGRNGTSALMFVADVTYRIFVHLRSSDGVYAEAGCVVSRINDDGQEEVYEFESAEWERRQYMTQKQKNDITPMTTEYDFFMLLLNMFGPMSDPEYAHIRNRNGKLIRLARRLPKKMMMFDFLNDEGTDIEGVEDTKLEIGLLPQNIDANGIAVKQRGEMIQICQYFNGRYFMKKRNSVCRVVTEFSSEDEAVKYIMFLLDHYYAYRLFIIPISQNAYVNYDSELQKGEIIAKGNITEEEQQEWNRMRTFLKKNPLIHLC